jgi:hypothetical protein
MGSCSAQWIVQIASAQNPPGLATPNQQACAQMMVQLIVLFTIHTRQGRVRLGRCGKTPLIVKIVSLDLAHQERQMSARVGSTRSSATRYWLRWM